MKEEIINQIQVQMLPYLNNEQLKALQSVLEHTFYSVTITTENVPDTTNKNAVTAFIAAKRIEGCSEKNVGLLPKHHPSDDFRHRQGCTANYNRGFASLSDRISKRTQNQPRNDR